MKQMQTSSRRGKYGCRQNKVDDSLEFKGMCAGQVSPKFVQVGPEYLQVGPKSVQVDPKCVQVGAEHVQKGSRCSARLAGTRKRVETGCASSSTRIQSRPNS